MAGAGFSTGYDNLPGQHERLRVQRKSLSNPRTAGHATRAKKLNIIEPKQQHPRSSASISSKTSGLAMPNLHDSRHKQLRFN